MSNSKVIIAFGAVVAALLASGCRIDRTPFKQRLFALEAARNNPQQKISKDIVLDIQDFSVVRAFATKSLVYRKGRSEYETDFYNQFVIRPEDMITEQTRAWLSDSSLFKVVLEPGSYVDATHVLEGNILALYGDFRKGSPPKATMKIRFFLITVPGKVIAFTKTYEGVSEFQDRTAESLIEAYDKCLAGILAELEEDLREVL